MPIMIRKRFCNINYLVGRIFLNPVFTGTNFVIVDG